jgi:hypothetical protein
VVENGAATLGRLTLPQRDLARVETVLTGHSINRLEPSGCIQSSLKLELGVVPYSAGCHSGGPPPVPLDLAISYP